MESLLPEQPPHWLLEKYRDGRCSAEEITLVDKWFDTGGYHTNAPTEQADIKEVQDRVMQVIRSGRRTDIRRLRWMVAATVASIMVAAGMGLIWRSRPAPAMHNNMLTFRTMAGEQKRIMLPDSSMLLLNSRSQVKFTQVFGKTREVYLEGEAFFDVKPDATKAFRVITDSLQVLVLGTRFNLSSYANSLTRNVTLESGKVAIYTGEGKSTTLRPGETLHYSGRQVQVTHADMEATMAWQKGFLIYKNTALSEICKDLERRYNVNIRINDPKTAAAFYHYSSRQVPLTSVLKVLSETGRGFRFHTEGNNITIY